MVPIALLFLKLWYLRVHLVTVLLLKVSMKERLVYQPM